MSSHERRTGYDRGDYNSGDDYVLEYEELRYTFNKQDFGERLEQSAKKLGIIFDETVLTKRQLKDLREFATDGAIRKPRTFFGEHLGDIAYREALQEEADPDSRGMSLISWTRRLVFRGAWLDQRVMEGELDVTFDEETGDFLYNQPDRGNQPIVLAKAPNYWENCLDGER